MTRSNQPFLVAGYLIWELRIRRIPLNQRGLIISPAGFTPLDNARAPEFWGRSSGMDFRQSQFRDRKKCCPQPFLCKFRNRWKRKSHWGFDLHFGTDMLHGDASTCIWAIGSVNVHEYIYIYFSYIHTYIHTYIFTY